jgi:adenosylcobinamide-phosphate synthase
MSNPTILLLALVIDAVIGDPESLYRAIPHPATVIGRIVDWLDRALNDDTDRPGLRRFWGIVAVVFLVGGALTIGWIVDTVLSLVPYGGWVIEAALISTLIAQNSLYLHVSAVAKGLEAAGVEGGREAVQHVVGRDPDTLDEHGVARAALESLAENLSDAVTAPIFWALLLLGLPGILAYKVINTADSMIGHRSERHEHFGWAAARLDDLLNYLPARIAGVILCGAAALGGGNARAAWDAMWRDAPKHHSPSAGWPEAAMAGALGLALAGPRVYDGELVEDAWMGAGGRTDATAADIRRGLRVFVATCAIQAVIVGLIAIVMM